MRALGRFGRFTLFHHLSHHPLTLAVFLLFLLVFGFGLGFVVVSSCFVSVLQVSWNFSILRAF